MDTKVIPPLIPPLPQALHKETRKSRKETRILYRQNCDAEYAASISTITPSNTEKNTPTHTTSDNIESSPSQPNTPGIFTIPWHGNTYVILNRSTNKAVFINENGEVRLKSIPDVGMNHCCHWVCIEKEGWFGFKLAGRFLGHNNKGGFRADATRLDGWEFFNPRPHPDGGFLMMNRHYFGFRYMDVSKVDDSRLVVTEDVQDVALWNFVKV